MKDDERLLPRGPPRDFRCRESESCGQVVAKVTRLGISSRIRHKRKNEPIRIYLVVSIIVVLLALVCTTRIALPLSSWGLRTTIAFAKGSL